MSDTISRKALLDFIDVSVEGVPCKYISIDLLRRETNNGTFNIPSTESEKEIDRLKAITELAVKGLQYYADETFYEFYGMGTAALEDKGDAARLILAEIERLSQ